MTSRKNISIGVLLLFHLIGVVLFYRDPENAKLSYVTLILTFLLLVLNERHFSKELPKYLAVACGGYLIEIIGVKTGVLFGHYQYGDALGFKVYGTPLLIGINWLITVRVATDLANAIFASHWTFRALMAGLMATSLDALIEPVAQHYNFWTWENGEIPFWNYICWFIFSSIFATLFTFKKSELNVLSIPIFITWAGFFTILNFVI